MATVAPRPALPLFWFLINVRSPSSEFPLVIKIEQGASMCKQEQVVVFQFLIVKKIHHLLKAGMALIFPGKTKETVIPPPETIPKFRASTYGRGATPDPLVFFLPKSQVQHVHQTQNLPGKCFTRLSSSIIFIHRILPVRAEKVSSSYYCLM